MLHKQPSHSNGDTLMIPFRVAGSTVPSRAGTHLTSAGVFKLVWDALADLLGTAATAAIMERASRRAQARAPELVLLSFQRVDGEFGYHVPPAFEHSEVTPGLRAFLEDLRVLLLELTGPVALRRLAQVPQLRAWAEVGP